MSDGRMKEREKETARLEVREPLAQAEAAEAAVRRGPTPFGLPFVT